MTMPAPALGVPSAGEDDDQRLLAQPIAPTGTILIVEVRGGSDKQSHGHRGDTLPIANALIREGWSCRPVFYSDSEYDQVLSKLISANAFIVRVNPGVYDGVTQERLDQCLRAAAAGGAVAMSHPGVMRQMGAKDALHKIRGLTCGMADTQAYYDMDAFKATFPQTLATGPRVLKQNRGSQGEGIWVVKLEQPGQGVTAQSMLILQEARDNHIEKRTLADFMEHCACYLKGEDGLLVDQRFLPRISEGEYRINMIFDFPIEVVHKKPKAGGISATLNSGAQYTFFSPQDPEVRDLVSNFVHNDLPEIMPALGMRQTPLPLLWAADFILDTDHDGNEKFCIGEFNCSCVGITRQLHLSALVAQAAVRIIAASHAAAVGMEALQALETISQQLEHPEDVDPHTINESAETIERAAHDVGLDMTAPSSIKLPSGELRAYFANLAKTRSTDKLDELQDVLHAQAAEVAMAAANVVVDAVAMSDALSPCASPTGPSSGRLNSPFLAPCSPRVRLQRANSGKEQQEHRDVVQHVASIITAGAWEAAHTLERDETGAIAAPHTSAVLDVCTPLDTLINNASNRLAMMSASPMKVVAAVAHQLIESKADGAST